MFPPAILIEQTDWYKDLPRKTDDGWLYYPTLQSLKEYLKPKKEGHHIWISPSFITYNKPPYELKEGLTGIWSSRNGWIVCMEVDKDNNYWNALKKYSKIFLFQRIIVRMMSKIKRRTKERT